MFPKQLSLRFIAKINSWIECYQVVLGFFSSINASIEFFQQLLQVAWADDHFTTCKTEKSVGALEQSIFLGGGNHKISKIDENFFLNWISYLGLHKW